MGQREAFAKQWNEQMPTQRTKAVPGAVLRLALPVARAAMKLPHILHSAQFALATIRGTWTLNSDRSNADSTLQAITRSPTRYEVASGRCQLLTATPEHRHSGILTSNPAAP
jgi:hypothetical protein